MKYFTLIFFFFLTLIANAQLTMEEIAYVPSSSGYYNHLIVKGDVNINELWTYPLNIQSYGSFLDITVNNSGTAISSITISTNTFVSLKNVYSPAASLTHAANITMKGGKLSVQQKNLNVETQLLDIKSLTSINNLTDSTIKYKTEKFYPNTTTNAILPVKNLYIMGMQVPRCSQSIQWDSYTPQEGTTFYILSCGQQS